MNKIRKILICNHSHTDIGFTDYQDACFRQHAEFVEQALDLIEKTDNFPEEAKYKWTVETTGPFIEYLKNAKSSQIDRFIKWYKKGRIDVAGMQYNFTPLSCICILFLINGILFIISLLISVINILSS